jgi:hypothetical protein
MNIDNITNSTKNDSTDLNSNIILIKKKILQYFRKYSIKYKSDIFKESDNILFLELCKIPNIHFKIIKLFFNSTLKFDKEKSYKYIYNSFLKSSFENIENNIKCIKYFVKYLDSNEKAILKETIDNILDKYNSNKNIYSSLKSLEIYINKYLNDSLNKYINNKKINIILKEIIELSNNSSNPKLLLYINKILFYLKKNDKYINFGNIYKVFKSLLKNKDIIQNSNIKSILNIINKCKKNILIPENDLENILLKIDPNIYNYIYFLNNTDNLILDKEKSLLFLSNFDYNKKDFKEIDNLNLKRGFIQGIIKNNKDYLLKYQPNKSVMEIILNCYLKKYNSDYFLTPQLFYMNSDNSYFYIIEKYNSDLYKYFNILEENNKILTFSRILYILKFLINSIAELHNNNIIHSDLKPENIVLNYDNNNIENILDLRVIDFDVGVFDTIPQNLVPLSEKYEKTLKNKKIRGTRIYMMKSKTMEYKNDIFSLGVILLILLFKNIKLIIILKKKKLNSKLDLEKNGNKKIEIKYQSLIKKLNLLRDKIEDYNNKVKILDLIKIFLKKYKNSIFDFFDIDNIEIFDTFIELIIDCLNTRLSIEEIKVKYKSIISI